MQIFRSGMLLLVVVVVAGSGAAQGWDQRWPDAAADVEMVESGTACNTGYYAVDWAQYSGTESFPCALADIPGGTEGERTVERIAAYISNSTGMDVPQSVVVAMLNNSSSLLGYLSLSAGGIHDLWNGLNALYRSGMIHQKNQTALHNLPNPFAFPADMDAVPVDLADWLPSMSYVGADLWFGFFANASVLENGATRARRNVVMANVMNQLADNAHRSARGRPLFVVEIHGQNATSPVEFARAYLAASSSAAVSGYITKRAAAFFGLWRNRTGCAAAECARPVANPLMMLTEVKAANGTQAVLPAVHSEFVITFDTAGADGFGLVWYQGDDGIGFFPGEIWQLENWVGGVDGPTVSSYMMAIAMQYMGLIRSLWVDLAETNQLYDEGYGITGVCDDSTAILEYVLFGSGEEFPLVLVKDVVLAGLAERVALADSNLAYYTTLQRIVTAMPVDWEGLEASVKTRALGSIVWQAGKSPFPYVEFSRRLLQT